MKTYSAMWETGDYLFRKEPGSKLLELVPNGFKPLGRKSKLPSLKGIPHDVFEGPFGRKLIVMEDA